MARVFITGSADGLGRAAAENLLDDGHEVVVHARSERAAAAVARSRRPRGRAVSGTSPTRTQTRASPSRSTGSAGWTPSSTTPASTPARRSCRSTSSPRTCSRLSSTARGGWCTSAAACTAADGPTSPASTGAGAARRLLLRQQALRHHPRRRRRPAVARRAQQRGRPRLGPDQDGRPGRVRRPPARARHPGVARHQRGSRGAHAAAATGTTSGSASRTRRPRLRFQDELLAALAAPPERPSPEPDDGWRAVTVGKAAVAVGRHLADDDPVAVVPALDLPLGLAVLREPGELGDGRQVREVVDGVDHAGLWRVPGLDPEEPGQLRAYRRSARRAGGSRRRRCRA